MARVVVVGGGIAGLLAARVRAGAGDEVTLVEREAVPGGLLRSVANDSGDWFDFGTHFAHETGVAALDAVLFEEVRADAWRRFDWLEAGAFFAGRLGAHAFADLRHLAPDEHARAVVELLVGEPPVDLPATLEDQLLPAYGPTITDRLFRPALKKLFGVELGELVPDAHKLFGLARLIALTPYATAELKRSPHYAEKLNLHTAGESPSPHKARYPLVGGVGQWVEGMTAGIVRRGATLACGRGVRRLERVGRRVVAVELDDGMRLPCDELIWTAPLALALRAGGVTLASGPPTLRTVSLHHFTFDRPPPTGLHYFTCYDERYATFRVTLYSNVQPVRAAAGRHSLTVEVLSSGPPADLAALRAQLAVELVELGAVAAGACSLYETSELVREGFPVLTPALVASGVAQRDAFGAEFDNAVALGKGSGAAFFMSDVLVAAWTRLAG